MPSLLDPVVAAVLAQDAEPRASPDEASAQDPAQDAPPDTETGEEAAGATEGAENALAEAGDFISNFDQDQAVNLAQTYLVPLALAIVVLLVGLILAGWIRRMVISATTRAKIEATLAKFFGSLAKWGVLILVGIVILGILGIETASFAVVLGAAGFAIGMAMQGSLGNLAAGVMLLIFRPYKVGQVVNISGVTGKVDEIELFTTTIDTFDNRRFIIPNGSIFGSTIENISFHPTRRVDVPVGIEYKADLDRSREVLMQAAMSLDNLLEDPAPVVFLGDLGDSAVSWTVRVWVNAEDFWSTKEALTRAVKQHLDDAGIAIPFPQMDVHLDKGE